MTLATRPVPGCWPPDCCGVSRVAVTSSSTRGERIGAADDLADFLGDLGLACRVRCSGERLDELVRVVGRRLHGATPGAGLRCCRLEQRREDPALDVPREQCIEHLLGT